MRHVGKTVGQTTPSVQIIEIPEVPYEMFMGWQQTDVPLRHAFPKLSERALNAILEITPADEVVPDGAKINFVKDIECQM